MQRIIKFRAWNKVKKKMFFVHEIMFVGSMLTLSPEKEHNINNIFHESNFVSNELMQFTGLLDKNGKEIFEGDIVKFTSIDKKEYIEKVSYVIDEKYGGGNIQWVNISGYENRYCFNERDFSGYITKWNSFEVIGNVYENNDLLPNT